MVKCGEYIKAIGYYIDNMHLIKIDYENSTITKLDSIGQSYHLNSGLVLVDQLNSKNIVLFNKIFSQFFMAKIENEKFVLNEGKDFGIFEKYEDLFGQRLIANLYQCFRGLLFFNFKIEIILKVMRLTF